MSTERNIPLAEIGASARAAAYSEDVGPCPYPRGSAAAWCWIHVYSAALAQTVVTSLREPIGGDHA